jgi:hypothetical protein
MIVVHIFIAECLLFKFTDIKGKDLIIIELEPVASLVFNKGVVMATVSRSSVDYNSS